MNTEQWTYVQEQANEHVHLKCTRTWTWSFYISTMYEYMNIGQMYRNVYTKMLKIIFYEHEHVNEHVQLYMNMYTNTFVNMSIYRYTNMYIYMVYMLCSFSFRFDSLRCEKCCIQSTTANTRCPPVGVPMPEFRARERMPPESWVVGWGGVPHLTVPHSAYC